MKKKVIYISFIRLTDKTSRDWFIDYLLSRDVHVEYWDVVGAVRKSYHECAEKITDYLHVINTYDDLERRLGQQDNNNTHYVILFSYAASTLKFYRLLTKFNCEMSHIVWGAVPLGPRRPGRILCQILSNPARAFYEYWSRGVAFAFRKFRLIKQFDVVFAAGESMLSGRHYAKRVVPINFADYIQYQTAICNDITQSRGRSYAVFLDVYLPYHPDAAILGWSTVNPEKYYMSLDKFFSMLELKYNIEIVIAAHPRSDYRNLNPFFGRRIFFGKTPDLTREAEFVISHSSISQSYAILNRKQIIFIFTDEMLSVYRGTDYLYEIYDAASYLNCPLYNIDDITSHDDIEVGDIDTERYDAYKYNYLVSRQCEGEQTTDIFWREVFSKQ